MMETLPDYLDDGLDLVFVGLNPSEYSVRESHYFANPRNRFWAAFNASGLRANSTGHDWTPADDGDLLAHGIGFTDVVKHPTAQGSGLRAADYRQWAPVLREKLHRWQPRVVCFHGLMAYKAYLRYAEDTQASPSLGLQERNIGESCVFVVPNPSPANAKYSIADLTGWYRELGDALAQAGA